MDFLSYFWPICILASLPMWYLIYNKKYMQASKVFVDLDDNLLIAHVPLARVFTRFAKVVPKSNIDRIQIAGNMITIFSKSNNAIDVWIPRKDFVEPAKQRALALCNGVDVVYIDR